MEKKVKNHGEEAKNKAKIIFFGNGMLAEYTLKVLAQECEIIFQAHTKEDLQRAVELKQENPAAHGVLASFGIMIKQDVLDAFEPEGILNIHPSLLPAYRGASPIETAILNGDTDFSVSVMKLAKAMDAGPVYYQTTLHGLPLNKAEIYRALAEAGANWLVKNLHHLPTPGPQAGTPTFTEKMTKAMGLLTPEKDSAEATLRKIVAFAGFPKAKYPLFGVQTIIHEAHLLKPGEAAPLTLPCADGALLALDRVQPEGRKPMDAKSFLNGYKKV